MFNAQSIKSDFPIFRAHPRLVYLDSTATTLKPQPVIDALVDYYAQYSANVFRGIYKISEKATAAYEDARGKVARFINAHPEEIVFVRNTTEALNLVLYAWATQHVDAGDEIVVTLMEHHSNFVPWQQLAQKKGARLTLWHVDETGTLHADPEAISAKTKLVALTAVSNVLGTITPYTQLSQDIKRQNPDAAVIIDAAQAVPHMSVDVQSIGADFLAFSGHKMLGPTGIGVLWGKKELLESMTPFNYGGEMIQEVRVDKTYFAKVPHKFEAGTPHIAGSIGLGAAVDYLTALDMQQVRAHEQELVAYALERLNKLAYLTVFGPADAQYRGGVVAFTMEGVHAHDVSQMLDVHHIATRSGHHCTMPLHLQLNQRATVRASFYVYTTQEDIDKLVEGLQAVHKKFKK